jgi:hypothetical protein
MAFTQDWTNIDETGEAIYLSVSGNYLPLEGDSDNNTFQATFLSLYNGYYIHGNGGSDTLELLNADDTSTNAGIWFSHAEIDLGSGNDLIEVTNEADRNSSLSFYVGTLLMGSGNDVVNLINTVEAPSESYFGRSAYAQYDGSQAHFGSGNDQINVISDNGEAYISMWYGAKLNMGNGDDSIYAEGTGDVGSNMGSGAFINFGKGDDDFTSINHENYGLGIWYGGKINFGKGDDTSYVSGVDGAELSGSVIDYGKGDDTATFINAGGEGQEVLSMYSGSVIDMGEGDNELIVINEGDEDDYDADGIFMWYGSSIIFEDGDDYLYSEAPGYALSMSSSSIIMGDGDDEIVLEQTVPHPTYDYVNPIYTESSLFDLGEGNDSITANVNNGDGWYTWSTTMRFGEGNDTWEVNNNWAYDAERSDGYATSFYDSNFFMGSGDDNVIFTNSYGVGLYLSSSTFLFEDGDDSLISDGTDGWSATWISRSTVDFGDGDDVFSTIYENNNQDYSWALSMYGATVSMGDGDDELTVETINNTDNLENTGIYLSGGLIDMGEGNDSLMVTGDNEYSIFLDEALIDLGEGNDDLYAEGEYLSFDYGTILSGEGNDDIELYAGAYNHLQWSAINTDAGNDTLTLTGEGEDFGLYMSSASILTGYGTDTVTISGDIYTDTDADWPDNVIDLGAGRRDVLVMDWLYDDGDGEGGDLIVNGGQGAGDILVIGDGEYQVTFEGAYLALQLTSAVEDSEGGIYTDEQKLLTMGFERLGSNRLKFNTLEDGDIITVLDGEASINDELLA